MSGATGSGLEQEDAGIGASQLLFGKKSLISCVHIVVLRLLQNTTRHLADASFKRAYSIETEKKKKKRRKAWSSEPEIHLGTQSTHAHGL